LGALILNAASYTTDNRDPQRHLGDAALLASLIPPGVFVLSVILLGSALVLHRHRTPSEA
jgi:hypothetical protein